jgi:lipopolysaccharide biosynthesis regulator YciM
VRFERKDDAGAIIQLKNALKADPGLLAAHMLMGRAALRKGDYASAEVALREAQRSGVSRAEYVIPARQPSSGDRAAEGAAGKPAADRAACPD